MSLGGPVCHGHSEEEGEEDGDHDDGVIDKCLRCVLGPGAGVTDHCAGVSPGPGYE